MAIFPFVIVTLQTLQKRNISFVIFLALGIIAEMTSHLDSLVLSFIKNILSPAIVMQLLFGLKMLAYAQDWIISDFCCLLNLKNLCFSGKLEKDFEKQNIFGTS